ncbi:UNVERIFIED_ORG: hypothetical protein ABIB19_002337 [Arthrobacter sp. UYEF10]
MLKDVLDYPTPAEEAEIIRRIDAGVFNPEQKPAAAASLDAVIGVQELVKRIYTDPAIINYIVGLVFVTRNAGQYIDRHLAGFIEFGASPREHCLQPGRPGSGTAQRQGPSDPGRRPTPRQPGSAMPPGTPCSAAPASPKATWPAAARS